MPGARACLEYSYSPIAGETRGQRVVVALEQESEQENAREMQGWCGMAGSRYGLSSFAGVPFKDGCLGLASRHLDRHEAGAVPSAFLPWQTWGGSPRTTFGRAKCKTSRLPLCIPRCVLPDRLALRQRLPFANGPPIQKTRLSTCLNSHSLTSHLVRRRCGRQVTTTIATLVSSSLPLHLHTISDQGLTTPHILHIC